MPYLCGMLWQGMLLGLSLSFLVGPLLFAVVEASLERGFRAGIALAAGIWLSDIAYMLVIYRWVDALNPIAEAPYFRFWVGLIGSLVLLSLGGRALMKKSAPVADHYHSSGDRLLDVLDRPEPPGLQNNWRRWGYLGYFLRGFLVNALNPFTVFFWFGLASAFVVSNAWRPSEVLAFFSGMIVVLIATDTLKAYAAKRIRQLLQARHLLRIQQGIGAVLIGFGMVLLMQTLSNPM